MEKKKVTIFFDDGSLSGELEAEIVFHKNGGTLSTQDLMMLLQKWESLQKKKKKPTHTDIPTEPQANK